MLAIPSLGFRRYLSAVALASAVVGNSSSGIIEVPAFGVPSVNIGARQQAGWPPIQLCIARPRLFRFARHWPKP